MVEVATGSQNMVSKQAADATNRQTVNTEYTRNRAQDTQLVEISNSRARVEHWQ